MSACGGAQLPVAQEPAPAEVPQEPAPAEREGQQAQFEKGMTAYNGGDNITALRLWRPLAEQGYAPSQFFMGIMYEQGKWVDQNDVEAVRWYHLAADQGYAEAQFRLGLMYNLGIGAPGSSVEAYKWYSLAAAQGQSEAAESRDTVRGQITPAQVAEGERLAAEWKPLAKGPAASPPGKGETFRECSDCPEMVTIPAGVFEMGSPDDEGGRYDSEDEDSAGVSDIESLNTEYPQRDVSVARFAAGRFEVTHDEWAACVEKTDQSAYKAHKEKSETGDAPYWVGCEEADATAFGRGRNPVIKVSWDDAQGYVRWLNLMVSGTAETGPYRLLSEAEWEYAARGTTRFGDEPVTRFSWGNEDPVCTRGAARGAVFNDCKNIGPQPVGFSAPNAFGLHDMHGNVAEWTQDCWNDSYEGAPRNGSARTSGDCTRRVVRGGSWFYGPQYLRSTSRYWGDSSYRDGGNGFRVARTL